MAKTHDVLSTQQAADELGVPVHRLRYLVRIGAVEPTKHPGGHYSWSPADVRAAKKVFEKRAAQLQGRGIQYG